MYPVLFSFVGVSLTLRSGSLLVVKKEFLIIIRSYRFSS